MTDLERGEWIKSFTGHTHSVDIRAAMLGYPIGTDNPEAAFRQKDICDALKEKDISLTSINMEFSQLRQLGMIANSTIERTEAGIYVARTESPAWLAVATTVGVVNALFPEQ